MASFARLLSFTVALQLACAPLARAVECIPPVAEQVTGARAVGGTSFETTDGRTVRLAGVVAPDEAHEALEALVAGKSLALRPLSRPRDRWDRLVAYVETAESPPRSLAAALIADGHGNAAATGRPACLDALLAAEAQAREAKRGIWADPAALVPVTDAKALTAQLGRHVVAEGTIASARLVRGRVYLNFARYWRGRLSIVIAERDWPAIGRGAAPESMAGRRVRVRGWLEWRGGPAILADVAEPVEPIDGRPLAPVEQ